MVMTGAHTSVAVRTRCTGSRQNRTGITIDLTTRPRPTCGRPPPRKVFCSVLIRSLASICPGLSVRLRRSTVYQLHGVNAAEVPVLRKKLRRKVPSVGPIRAVLLRMKTADPTQFRSGRQFAAWIGLTPKDHSTAGKVRLGRATELQPC